MSAQTINQPRNQAAKAGGSASKKKPTTPYVGSVRFFKHIITGFVIIMMIVPWIVMMFVETPLIGSGSRSSGLGDQSGTAPASGGDRSSAREDELNAKIEEYQNLLKQSNSELTTALADLNTKTTQLEAALSLYDFDSPYGHLHPELRVEGPDEYIDSEGIVYLTFDDGPSGYTRAVLDVLKKHDIKATFFLVGYAITGREEVLKQIVAEGHTIGIHTYSHVYKDIYSSLEAYLDDFAACSNIIEEVTGIKPNIYRFPGGSLNTYNERWGNTIISETLSRGYRFYDWNVGSGDSAMEADADTIYDAVIRQVRGNSYSVVLMHDGGGSRSTTVTALPLIIDRLKREGYTFDKLTNKVRPTVFTAAGYNRG